MKLSIAPLVGIAAILLVSSTAVAQSQDPQTPPPLPASSSSQLAAPPPPGRPAPPATPPPPPAAADEQEPGTAPPPPPQVAPQGHGSSWTSRVDWVPAGTVTYDVDATPYAYFYTPVYGGAGTARRGDGALTTTAPGSTAVGTTAGAPGYGAVEWVGAHAYAVRLGAHRAFVNHAEAVRRAGGSVRGGGGFHGGGRAGGGGGHGGGRR